MSELIDRQALRAAHGLGSDCHDCKRDLKSCQYDRDYSLMDFCEWLDDAPAASPWHRVEEELPPDGKEVWCAIYTTDLIVSMPGESVSEAMMRCQKEAARHPRCEMGAYYKGEGWSESLFGAPMVCAPKYWCYLPEPPKEDA